MNTQLAEQSPEWDATLSLDEMIGQAKFFILRRKGTGLVNIVTSSKMANGFECYQNFGLSHDRYGITYYSDGSLRADYIGELIADNMAVLTKDPIEAKRHIWECMNCRAFSAFGV